MARIRTIKPSFFKNEELAEIPMACRILFIGLWCLADKEGRLEDRPKRIKAEIFPYDNIEIDQQLSRLQSAGFIIRYSVDNTKVGELKVIQIINFSKHQRITGSEAESESDFPAPVMGGNTLETTWKHSGNNLDDRKGKEGKGREGNNEFFQNSGGHDQEPDEDIPPKQSKKTKAQDAAPREISHPFSDIFNEKWQLWRDYKSAEFKFRYKVEASEQAAMNDLVKKSGSDETTAIAIIEQSMANGWKGFFELKKQFKNGIDQTSRPGTSAARVEALKNW
jgi:hypothetical protein